MAFLRSSILAVCALLLAAAPLRAEPLLVSIEGTGALPLGAPQSDRFGVGAAGALSVYYPLAPALLLGGRLRAGFLSDGDAPTELGLADPGVGTLETLSAVLRLRPLAAGQGVRRATGLFVDVGGGGGVTGDLTRGAFEAGLGYGFGLGSAALAPVLRYVQVVQPKDSLSGADARVLMLGAELTLFDTRPLTAAESNAKALEPADLDKDGIPDPRDACADQPEDFDGYQDKDGCPDADNDKDGIPDAKDKCPDSAEDVDEHDDADGCPDPDNDDDGFLDADDQCPNEPEVVNGNKDYDGCSDEGLIEMKNDRIVLEERVLFDFERARVKREARPILRAIVTLKAQHPEWIKLRIEGHADEQGDAGFNQEVSERRANNVMRELIKLGIPASQIEAVGFGATRPRDLRKEAEANARNRRVEFVVMARGVAPEGTETTLQPAAAAGDEDEAEDEQAEPEPPAPPAHSPAPAPAAKPEVKP